MRKVALCGFLIALSLLALSCATQSKMAAPPVSAAPKRDVSRLVPAELGYAKEFVQSLSDSGWTVEAVYPSKFNSFFRETANAAFIQTDKGAVEVVFFKNDDDVAQIEVREEEGEGSQYRKYLVQTPMTKQRIEGAACYFTKHRNMFIITTDFELNDALNRLWG